MMLEQDASQSVTQDAINPWNRDSTDVNVQMATELLTNFTVVSFKSVSERVNI